MGRDFLKIGWDTESFACSQGPTFVFRPEFEALYSRPSWLGQSDVQAPIPLLPRSPGTPANPSRLPHPGDPLSHVQPHLHPHSVCPFPGMPLLSILLAKPCQCTRPSSAQLPPPHKAFLLSSHWDPTFHSTLACPFWWHMVDISVLSGKQRTAGGQVSLIHHCPYLFPICHPPNPSPHPGLAQSPEQSVISKYSLNKCTGRSIP